MSTNSKIKSIVTIDAYEKIYCALKDSKFKQLKRLAFNNSNFNAAYIHNKDLISTSIEVSKSIPLEDIQDIIEIKAYEELGLDQADEYIIRYAERESTSEERIFDVFIAEPNVLEERFGETVDETKFIDLLIPAPLLFRSIYTRDLLASEGVHLFLYFGNQDTFVSFYKNGKHLYSKSIEYSSAQMYDKYCEIAGNRVSEEEFFNILYTEGLRTIHSDYQQNFTKLFGEIFISINDIVIYARRAFDISKIDQVFIGGDRGTINGLDEYTNNYLGLHSSELNFNFNIETDDWHINQLHYMLLVAAIDYVDETDQKVNLTIFERAPAFHKRPSGQFIITTLLAISLGMAYPLYFLARSYINDATNLVLSKNEEALKAESDKYKQILGEKQKEIKALDEKIGGLSKIYFSKEKTLTTIYDKKVNYRLKSELFYRFAQDISKFDVKIDQFMSDQDTYTISLLSKDDKEITKLIKHISDTYFDKINSIGIETIKKDQESELYNSVLKVELR